MMRVYREGRYGNKEKKEWLRERERERDISRQKKIVQDESDWWYVGAIMLEVMGSN